MNRTLTYALVLTTGFAMLAGVVLAALALYPRSAWYHNRAREQWEQQHVSHYEIEAMWASNWSFGHVRAEVLNDRVVSGVDLETGEPLSLARRVSASYFVAIDYLFPMIQQQIRPSSSWRFQLARYHPLLSRWLDPCAALLPQISYDPTYGYPTSINYRGTPCYNGGNVILKIERFQPLP